MFILLHRFSITSLLSALEFFQSDFVQLFYVVLDFVVYSANPVLREIFYPVCEFGSGEADFRERETV